MKNGGWGIDTKGAVSTITTYFTGPTSDKVDLGWWGNCSSITSYTTEPKSVVPEPERVVGVFGNMAI